MPLLQTATVCCSGWQAARAEVNRPDRWAAGSHRESGEVGGGSPLEVEG